MHLEALHEARASVVVTPEAPRGPDTPPAEPTDEGLRSPLGIRWLLVVGASVVAVSVVRLVAAEWQHLAPTVQYLLLVVGALGVFGAGDVLRRRLHLPVAGTALLGLYSVLIALLAWGAARQGMLETPLGLLTSVTCLAALLATVPHLLRTTLGLGGRILPAAFGAMVLAIPTLPWMEGFLVATARPSFFLASSLGLAGVLSLASRHLNRELFHRDRTRLEERAVHLLPFLALIATYALACASLEVFGSLFAVPLAFASLTLMETGAEYQRALSKALRRPLETWPLRSRALMATGIAGLVVSVPLAFAGAIEGAAVVVTLVATRLLVGGVRSRRALDYAAGLGFAVLAYHLVPTLVPDALRELYRSLLAALGLAGTGAAISLADVGLLALLVAAGHRIRYRLTTTQLRLHGAAIALVGMFAVMVALTDFAALRVLVFPVTAILVVALVVLRTPAPLVALYQGSILGILVWSDGLSLGGINTAGVVTLACANLAWMVAAEAARRRKLFPGEERLLWGRLAAGPGLLMAMLLAVPALVLEPWVGLTLWLTGGAVVALTGPLVRSTQNRTDDDPFLTVGLVAMVLAAPALGLFRLVEEGLWTPFGGALASLGLAVLFRLAMIQKMPWGRSVRIQRLSWVFLAGTLSHGLSAAFLAFAAEPAGNPWLSLAPAFLASALFALLAHDDHLPSITATISASLFAVATTALVYHLPGLTREVYCLGPGLGLLTLAALLRSRIGEVWTSRLVTAGATCLYAMPVWGLLGEVAWGWQALLLVLAVGFGAIAFPLRSRSLLLASSAALAIDLAFFLVELRRAAPSLLWVLGIVFGLTLMALAALLEHRREAFQQRLRVWGAELRTWS